MLPNIIIYVWRVAFINYDSRSPWNREIGMAELLESTHWGDSFLKT